MTDHAVAIAGAGPTGLMASCHGQCQVLIVERRTKHEADGSRDAGLPSRAVGTRPGLAASPLVVRRGSVAETRSERDPTG